MTTTAHREEFPDAAALGVRPAGMTWQPPRFDSTEFFARRTRNCVVVIVWNEGDRLRDQLERMRSHCDQADVLIADWRSDDGSTAPEALRRAGVRALLTTDEGGLGTAIRMALAYALEQGYEGVVTVDGNGKDGVQAIPRFIRELDAGYDLVQGSRFLRGAEHANTPLDRYVGIRFVVSPLLSIAARYFFTDPTNGFRGLSRRYLTDPGLQPIRAEFVRFNLQLYLVYRARRLGCRIVEIPVRRVYPTGGSIPTKINDLRTKLLFLWQLVRTVAGTYNPDDHCPEL